MHSYGVRDVEKLLRLSRSTIRSLIAAGFVSPARGPRGAWRFSFQDLIVLRTAQALADANVPPRRIMRSMRELRRQLPDTMPLSGLSIGAVADRVVVREGGSRWQAESGQYLLGLRRRSGRRLVERDRARATPAQSRAAARSVVRPGRGARARRTSMRRWRRTSTRSTPIRTYLDAYINLGRLLHEARRLAKAESVYREAIKACGDDPVLLYNLGVLLEDMERGPRRWTRTRRRCARDPGLRRLPLQPGAAVRKARQAEGRDPAHGAVSRADGKSRPVVNAKNACARHLLRSASFRHAATPALLHGANVAALAGLVGPDDRNGRPRDRRRKSPSKETSSEWTRCYW